MADVIGWASSIILVATILTQIRKQWQSGTSKGVSIWLFLGQIAASVGFAIYSGLIGSRVFIVTNLFMAASAVLGLLIVWYHSRRAESR